MSKSNKPLTKPLPIAKPIIVQTAQGANGTLYLGSKIKTKYQLGNDTTPKWYNGTITQILDNNICCIDYDFGFSVTGNAQQVYLIQPVIENLPIAIPMVTSPILSQTPPNICCLIS